VPANPELVINLTVAQELSVDIPESVRKRATLIR
jgi:ABC-type uncharacterized transport system substrate-binding protein